jgi:hypothetical protein
MKKNFFRNLFLKLLAIFFAGVTFLSCQKEIGDGIVTPPAPGVNPHTNLDLNTKVTAKSISGFVTNESNVALQGVSVAIGNATVTTDKYGYFETKDIEVIKNAAVITARKTGYFNGIKTYIAEQGKSAFFRIKLLEKTPLSNFSAATGGSISSADGIKIVFPAAAIVTTSGAAYSGNVKVVARWINPTANDLQMIMPGDLRGIDSLNTVKKLTTYGMTAVELTGTSGESLEIAPGKKATVTIPLPSTISGTAPSNILLWHFDESKGLWKQEGSAIKTGNSYVGEVSHFSFWNCDVPAEYSQFNCTLKTTTGLPLAFVLVKISKTDAPQNQAYAYTDSAGYVSGAVPGNSALKMEVFSNNSCGSSFYSQTFNTATAVVSLGTITVTVPTVNSSMVSGSVTNCNNAPVANGFINMRLNNQNFRFLLSNTGTYSFVHTLCNGPQNVLFTAEDLTGQQSSSPVNYTINPGNNAIPDIKACGISTQQFITHTARGVTKSLVYPTDSFSLRQLSQGFPTYTAQCASIADPANYITFLFNPTGISVGSVVPVSGLNSILLQPASYFIDVNDPIMMTVTEYGGPGGYISGNMSCNLLDRTPMGGQGPPFAFTCSFRLKLL